MDNRTDRLNAAINDLIAERDNARRWAEEYRGMLQANGVLPETERLPWEDE